MKAKVLALCILLAGCGGKESKPHVRFGTIGTGIQICCLPFYLVNYVHCMRIAAEGHRDYTRGGSSMTGRSA